jgi:hypothetical protein
VDIGQRKQNLESEVEVEVTEVEVGSGVRKSLGGVAVVLRGFRQ